MSDIADAMAAITDMAHAEREWKRRAGRPDTETGSDMGRIRAMAEAAAPHLEAAARERCAQLAELVHASYYAGTDEHGPNLRQFADLLRAEGPR